MRMATSLPRLLFVISPRSNCLGGEDIVQIMAATRTTADPPLDAIEHVFLHFDIVASRCGVVEDFHAVIQNLLDGNVGMIPRVHDARGDEFQDFRGKQAGWLIQDITEMILAEHRVGGVCAVGIGPWFVLVFTT